MREMLRIKRSVQATYNVQVNYMAAQMMSTSIGEETPATQVIHNVYIENSLFNLNFCRSINNESFYSMRHVIFLLCIWKE